MQLETLTLQSHCSAKEDIKELYASFCSDPFFSNVTIDVFFRQNSILYVIWHLKHPSKIKGDCSPQCAQLIEILRSLGHVSYNAWLPINTITTPN